MGDPGTKLDQMGQPSHFGIPDVKKLETHWYKLKL